ncbi:MAG: hypothetical protein OHK0013_20870 [Sandaracinaceae bacterium]
MRFPRPFSVLVVWALLVGALLVVPGVADAQRRRSRDTTAQRQPATPTRIVFDLLPDGAEVLVDEMSVGFGPLGPIDVSAGEHSVRVRLQGYSEYTDVVTVAAGEELHVPVDLIPLAHVLSVESTPAGARLFVDERFAGETPTDVELVDGSHQLRLSLRGFEDVTRTIEAVAGQRDTWAVELVALPEQGPAQWYEDPIVWIIAGASVVAVTVAIVAIVLAAQPAAPQLDQFCMPEGRCIRFDPPF